MDHLYDDLVLLILILAIGFALVALFVSIVRKVPALRTAPAATDHPVSNENSDDADVVPSRRLTGGRRRGGVLARMRAGRADGAPVTGDVGPAEDGADQASPFSDGASTKKLGKKKLQRLEKKRERQQHTEQMRAVREERQVREEQRQEEQRRRDEERQVEEERELEEEAKRQALKEEEEHQEYLMWKDLMSVEDEGTMAHDESESQGLLQEFIDTIRRHKVVALDRLAARMDLKVQDVIDRIKSLEEQGRLTGVFDDRGKFIYISPEEMTQVADHIKKVGRVSLSDLAATCSQLIDLEGGVDDDDDDPDDAQDSSLTTPADSSIPPTSRGAEQDHG